MGMSDEVSRIPYRKREWVAKQLGDEAAEFELLLADREVPPIDLYNALRRRNIDIPERTVYAWATTARRVVK